MSSAAAALIVHEFWRAGAIVGAAVTPVLVALFSECLRAPVVRMSGPRRVRGHATGTVRVYRTQPRWGPALATACVAFLVGAAGLTASELALDRSVGGERERTTLFGSGRGGPDAEASTPAPTTTAPTTTTSTTPRREKRTPRRPARRVQEEAQVVAPPTTTTQPVEPVTTSMLPAPEPEEQQEDPGSEEESVPIEPAGGPRLRVGPSR